MTFRALNAAVNSKHVWVRGEHAPEAFEALMLMMFLAFTLVPAYRAQLDPEALRQAIGIKRVTLGYLAECWALSMPSAVGMFAPTD